MHPGTEDGSVGRQVFKPDAKFLRLLHFTFPMIVGSDRPVHLGTDGQPRFYRTAGEAVGVSPLGGSGPSYEHGRSFSRKEADVKASSRGAAHDLGCWGLEGRAIVIENQPSPTGQPVRAHLVRDQATGGLVLKHPPGTPPITSEQVRAILADIP